MAHLKGTLDHFAAADVRRGDHAPASGRRTSPSPSRRAEVDLVCFVCRGVAGVVETCRTCQGEGWIEWGGCGVVNPRVLTACGVDTERYTGFAFGMGIDRIADVPPGVEDLRDALRGRRALLRRLRDGDAEMKAPVSWIREYVDLPGRPAAEDARPPADRARPQARGARAARRRDHRSARRRPGAHASSPSRRRTARPSTGAPSTSVTPTAPASRRASSAAPTTSPPATSSSWCCPAACCPVASRSPRARPTATSRPG